MNDMEVNYKWPIVDLEGMKLHAINEHACVQHIVAQLNQGKGGWIITANADHLRRYTLDPVYRELVEAADLVVADGMPLIWLSSIQGTPLPQRIAGSSMVHTLTCAAAEHHRSLFLLGGDPGVAEEAAVVLKTRHPDLKIAGIYCPKYGFEKQDQLMDQLRQAVIEAGPDIIYVALGSPKQERLIRELRKELPLAWWLGVGISLSFITGRVRRAPWWVQKVGMEWMHRLFQEPRRLAKRYLMEDLPFIVRLILKVTYRRYLGS